MKNTITHSKAANVLEALGIICPEGQSRTVDITVRIQGGIVTGSPSEKAATCSSLSLETVGALLRHTGCTGTAAVNAAVKLVRGEMAPTPADKAWAEEFRARIAAECPKTPVAGRRSGELIIEAI